MYVIINGITKDGKPKILLNPMNWTDSLFQAQQQGAFTWTEKEAKTILRSMKGDYGLTRAAIMEVDNNG